MFRSLHGAYRTTFFILLICFSLSVVLSIMVGAVVDIDFSILSISFGFSLIGVYFIFRTACAYLQRVDEAASRVDLYMAVLAIFGFSFAYGITPSNNSESSSLTIILWYFPVIPYWASRWIAGKRLNRLAGFDPSVRNIMFSAFNYVFWMLGAPFIMRHTRLR